MEIKRKIKVIEYIEYDGIRFYKDKKGYWLSSRIKSRKPKRLHIYVWEKFNGEVPHGYHIHHKDHNTNNNNIENLALMTEEKHLSYHANLQNKEETKKLLLRYAQPKAIEWHKSKEGRQWHKEQYNNTKDKLHQRLIIKCLTCGKVIEVGKGGAGNKFCSNKCRSQYRRNIGIDNKEFICRYCGNSFVTNKYSPAKYCSKECRVIGKRENSKN